ncbi:MAG: ABC transporter ATP-binding protein [Parachlamydiales bacterium]|nr:ABC transporter ATP-binding protein [Parachlamydiales bacterium]
MKSSQTLIRVENLNKTYVVKKRVLQAVRNVSFSIRKGETLALVGESGCGKSTLGRTLLRLTEPTHGQIWFEDQSINGLSKSKFLPYRRKMQLIFQDPYASFNPRINVKEILSEPLELHQLNKGSGRITRITELLQQVGLNPDHMHRFPHEFSGGQRQRLGIARALAVNPEFIVCDEPVSALDVSVQAQIINLLKKLQSQYNLTYLFIAHQLAVVKQISHRVAVMYLGDLVELADTESLYQTPLHPYTQALLSAIPIPDPEVERKRAAVVVKGDVPSPFDPPKGCPFHTRCPFAMPICQTVKPELKEVHPGHMTSCHLY